MRGKRFSALLAPTLCAGALILAAFAAPASIGAAVQRHPGSSGWEPAVAGYRYTFPADFGAHERSRSEWWYYTGNVRDAGGRRFGFELTVFRIGVQHPAPNGSIWDINDLYFAHFAVSDVAARRFYAFDRTGRAAFGQAGAATGDERAWVGDWRVERAGNGAHLLHAASAGGFSLRLALQPQKPLVINGRAGISEKGSCFGCASHYYSFTRMRASGAIAVDGRRYEVSGPAWNDHEWGSGALQSGVVGWDWFSVQLQDGTDLMLYRLRRADGSSIPESSGTLVTANGRSRYVAVREFSVTPVSTWVSPHDGARYPSGWTIAIPSVRLRLHVTPLLSDQELVTTNIPHVAYWEGACAIDGTASGKAVSGFGYTELTGYAGDQGALR